MTSRSAAQFSKRFVGTKKHTSAPTSAVTSAAELPMPVFRATDSPFGLTEMAFQTHERPRATRQCMSRCTSPNASRAFNNLSRESRTLHEWRQERSECRETTSLKRLTGVMELDPIRNNSSIDSG